MLQQSTAPVLRQVDKVQNSAAMDAADAAVWDAIRHLFPPHAMVDQTDDGGMVISWTLHETRGRSARFAAPLLIRIEPALLLALWTPDLIERKTIARLQARVVRRELTGYDPLARIPTARVIVLGEEVFA